MPLSHFGATIPDSVRIEMDDVLTLDSKWVFKNIPRHAFPRLKTLPTRLSEEISRFKRRDRPDALDDDTVSAVIADLITLSAAQPKLTGDEWKAVLWIAKKGIDWIDSRPNWSLEGNQLFQRYEQDQQSTASNFVDSTPPVTPSILAEVGARVVGDELQFEIDAFIKHRVAERVAKDFQREVSAGLGTLIFFPFNTLQAVTPTGGEWIFPVGRILAPPVLHQAQRKAPCARKIVLSGETCTTDGFPYLMVQDLFASWNDETTASDLTQRSRSGDAGPVDAADQTKRYSRADVENLPADELKDAFLVTIDEAERLRQTVAALSTQLPIRQPTGDGAPEPQQNIETTPAMPVRKRTENHAPTLAPIITELSNFAQTDLKTIKAKVHRINQLLRKVAGKEFGSGSELQETVHSIQEIASRGGYQLFTTKDEFVANEEKEPKLAAGTPVWISAGRPVPGKNPHGRIAVTSRDDRTKCIRRKVLISLKLA
jgi:hypothetical protein